jgi:hypothetical protein
MRDVVDFTAPAGAAGSLVAAVILRRYLRRLIQRRNSFLARAHRPLMDPAADA